MTLRLLIVGLLAATLATTACSAGQSAPEGGCDRFVLDTDRGTLNGVPPTAGLEEVKALFPCATGSTEEGSPFNRGGGVFFLDHHFFFYTHADFIEVRGGFRGEVDPSLLARDRDEVVEILGDPTREADQAHSLAWDRSYGCLVLTFSGDRVDQIRVHAQGCAVVETQF